MSAAPAPNVSPPSSRREGKPPATTVARRGAIYQVPNGLSIFRLLCSPVIAALLLIDAHGLRFPAAILFALAAITDYLDGYLARRFQVVSGVGVFIDLMADKILVSTVLIVLVGTGAVPSWMAALIVAREFIVSGLRTHAAARGVQIKASQLGKWKTTITLIALVLTLLDTNHDLNMAALGIATAITVLSAIDYVVRNWQVGIAD